MASWETFAIVSQAVLGFLLLSDVLLYNIDHMDMWNIPAYSTDLILNLTLSLKHILHIVKLKLNIKNIGVLYKVRSCVYKNKETIVLLLNIYEKLKNDLEMLNKLKLQHLFSYFITILLLTSFLLALIIVY